MPSTLYLEDSDCPDPPVQSIANFTAYRELVRHHTGYYALYMFQNISSFNAAVLVDVCCACHIYRK